MNDKDIRTIGILKTMYQEERNLIGTDITNTNYTHRDKAQAIENLLKENEGLKKEKVVSQTTGRRNGKTIELAMQLRKEILELPEGKLYGIKNCQNRIIALTKDEVIPVAIIKEKIEELEKERQKYREENTIIDEDYFFDINSFDNAIWVLQELLEGK